MLFTLSPTAKCGTVNAVCRTALHCIALHCTALHGCTAERDSCWHRDQEVPRLFRDVNVICHRCHCCLALTLSHSLSVPPTRKTITAVIMASLQGGFCSDKRGESPIYAAAAPFFCRLFPIPSVQALFEVRPGHSGKLFSSRNAQSNHKKIIRESGI